MLVYKFDVSYTLLYLPIPLKLIDSGVQNVASWFVKKFRS